jgi:hypothetical protein
MTSAPSTDAPDAPPAARGQRLRHRAAYLLIILLLLFIVVLLPFAVASMLGDFRSMDTPNHSIAAIQGQPVDRGSVAVDLIGMNEWEGTVTFRVTAHQECAGPCRWRDRYRFVSIWGDDFQPSDRPTVELVIAVMMPMFGGAVVGIGSTRSSKPSLKISAATAPASLAFWYFCTNGQKPRCISAMFPAVSAGKSLGSQPLVLAPGPPGSGYTMSFVGTTFAVTSAPAENSATM